MRLACSFQSKVVQYIINIKTQLERVAFFYLTLNKINNHAKNF